MKRLMLITIGLMLATSAVAGENKTAQQKVWTDEYQYGANEEKTAVSENGKLAMGDKPEGKNKTAQQKVWTDEYQYGKNGKDTPKTGKPSEGGEFEVAPKK